MMNVLFLEQKKNLVLTGKDSVKNLVLSHAGGTISRDIVERFVM